MSNVTSDISNIAAQVAEMYKTFREMQAKSVEIAEKLARLGGTTYTDTCPDWDPFIFDQTGFNAAMANIDKFQGGQIVSDAVESTIINITGAIRTLQ